MRFIIFCFSLILFLFNHAHGQAPLLVPAPPSLEASSHIIIDHYSNKIIAGKNIDQKIEPASLTKLMTAYVVYEALAQGLIHEDDQVKVSKQAWQAEGSRMFIEHNSLVSVADLIKGMVVQSGNDASIALAEHVSGSEQIFATLMNQTAAQLGMKNTLFLNSTGLPDKQHYSTVYDIAILSQALINRFPEHYKLYAQREYTYNKITQYNRNALLDRDPSVDGIKTGYTKSAGFCLATSAIRDGMRLITVVAGNSNSKMRTQDSEQLLAYGFRFFATHRLYQAGQTLKTVRVWGGQQKEALLGVKEDFYITIPRGAKGKIDINSEIVDKPEAPIAAQQALGYIEAKYQDELLQKSDLIALQEIPKGNWVVRAWDAILLLFY